MVEPLEEQYGVCDECDGYGVVSWTCGEDTCWNEDWCGCEAGVVAREKWEEAKPRWHLERMAEQGVWNCECVDCRWARGEWGLWARFSTGTIRDSGRLYQVG